VACPGPRVRGVFMPAVRGIQECLTGDTLITTDSAIACARLMQRPTVYSRSLSSALVRVVTERRRFPIALDQVIDGERVLAAETGAQAGRSLSGRTPPELGKLRRTMPRN
jgi:hypothetical protein